MDILRFKKREKKDPEKKNVIIQDVRTKNGSSFLDLRMQIPEHVAIIEVHLEKLWPFVRTHRRPIGLFTIVIFALFSFGVFFPSRASVATFYPSVCLGGWQHPENAERAPTVGSDAPLEKFTADNSAFLGNSSAQIYCGTFEGEIPKDTLPKKFILSFNWSIDSGFVVHEVARPFEDVHQDANTTIEGTSTPAPEAADVAPLPAPEDSSSETVPDQSGEMAEPVPPADADSTTVAPDAGVTNPAPAPTDNSQSFLDTFAPAVAHAQDVPSSDADTFTDFVPVSPADGEQDTSSDSTTPIDSPDVSQIPAVAPTETNVQDSDSFATVAYTLDGSTWNTLGKVSLSNWRSAQFELPLATWDDISRLQISITPIQTLDQQPVVYLDAVMIGVEYENPATTAKPTVRIKNSDAAVLDGRTDFTSDEAPQFAVIDPNLSTGDIIALVKENKAEVVHDASGVLAVPSSAALIPPPEEPPESFSNTVKNIFSSPLPAVSSESPPTASPNDTKPIPPSSLLEIIEGAPPADAPAPEDNQDISSQPLSFLRPNSLPEDFSHIPRVRHTNGGTQFSLFSPLVAYASNGSFGSSPEVTSAVVLDAQGHPTNIKVAIDTVTIDGESRQGVRVPKPGRQFHAGVYTLQVTIETPEAIIISEQDFTWGVLAINTDKTVYAQGDSAYLQMGVLDNAGNTICDAALDLTITAPSGGTTHFTTDDESIVQEPRCGRNNVIDVPDYYAHYTVPSEDGTYTMTLVATTSNGVRTVKDTFEVGHPAFDVVRTGPTRIFPPEYYPMTFEITPEADWSGTVYESAPASFVFEEPKVSQKYDDVSVTGDTATISWKVDLKAGEKTLLGYRFIAPPESPQFYLLGPLEFKDENDTTVFKEAREWQIASDLTCTSQAGGGGLWNTAASWSCARVPTTADSVVISTAQAITIDSAPNSVVSVTINSGATLHGGSATLTIGNTASAGTSFTNNGGTWDSGTGTVVFNSNVTTGPTLLGGTGTFTGANQFNNMTVNPAQTGSRSYTMGKAVDMGGNLSITPSGSTSTRAFTLTLSGATTVAGSITVNHGATSTATLTTSSNALTAASITLSAASNTLTAASSLVTLTGTSGTLFTNSGTLTAVGTTSEWDITSASGTPSIFSAATTMHILKIDSAATVVNLGANLTTNSSAGNKLWIASGVFNQEGRTIIDGSSSTLQIDNGATYCIGGTTASTTADCASGATQTSVTIPSFFTNTFGATSTFIYLQNVSTTISAFSYGNLQISPKMTTGAGSLTYTAPTALSVANNFTLSPTASNTALTLTVNLATSGATVTGTTIVQPNATNTPAAVLDTTASNFPLTTGFLDLEASGTFTSRSSVVTLTGTSGTLFTNNGTLTAVGTTSEWDITSASGTPSIFSATTTLHILKINAAATVVNLGANFTTDANSGNNLWVATGVLNQESRTITAGTAGTLQIDSTGTLCLGGTTGATNATCDSGATQTVAQAMPSFTTYTFDAASDVIYLSNAATTISNTPTYGNLWFQPILTTGRTYTLGGAMTINGDFTINPNSAGANALAVNAAGTITVAATNTTTIERQGSSATASLSLRPVATNYNLSTGLLNVATGGTLTCVSTSYTGTITLSAISGTLFTRVGTFTQGDSTVTLSGNGSATVNSGTITFYTLTSSGTGTKSLGAAITVNNNFTISGGTLDDAGNQITGNITGTLSVSSGAILSLGAGAATTFPTSFTNAHTSLNAASTVVYNANVSQTVSGTPTYGGLQISAASGTPTKSLGAATTVNGNLTISVGTLDDAVHQITGNATNTLSMAAGTTLKLGGGTATTFPTLFTNAHTSLDVASTVVYNATVTQTISGTPTYGNLQLSRASGTPTKTLGAATVINGSLTVDASNTLATGGSSFSITLGGDFTQNGTFTANSGTVTLAGTAVQTLTGTFTSTSSFYNLTITNNSGVNPSGTEVTGMTASVTFASAATATHGYTINAAHVRVQYHTGSTYTFANIVWTGTSGAGNSIYFRNSATSGTWLLTVSGTQSISYVDVGRSDASGGSLVLANDGTSTDSLNNTNWNFIAGISISGTADTANNGATVKVSINSVLQAQTAVIGAGAWSITSVATPSSGDIITVFVDGVADANESTAVTKWTSGDVSGMVLNLNTLTIGSNQNTSVSIANLANYTNGSDEDVMQTSSGGTLTVDGGGSYGHAETLSVLSGNTFTTGTTDTVVSGHIDNAGTITATGNTGFTLNGTSGTLFSQHGTYTTGTSTVTITSSSGSPTISDYPITIYNLVINSTANSLRIGPPIYGNLTISNNFNINAGAVSEDGASIIGNATGVMTMASGTMLCIGVNICDSSGTGIQSVGNQSFPTNYTKAHITLNSASTVVYGADDAQTIASAPDYGNLKFLHSTTLSANRIYTADGALNINGDFLINPSAGAYTFKFNLGGAVTVAPAHTTTINGSTTTVVLSPNVGNNYNLTTGFLNIGTGATLDSSTTATSSTTTLTGTSGTLFTNGGTFSASASSTVAFTPDASVTLTSGAIGFAHLVFSPTLTGSHVYTFGAGAITQNTMTLQPTSGGANTLTVNPGAGGISTLSAAGSITISPAGSALAVLDTTGSNYAISTGNLIISNNGTFNLNGSTIHLYGTTGTVITLAAGGAFNAMTSTVLIGFAGTASVLNSAPVTFYNLTGANAGTFTATLGADITVNNLLHLTTTGSSDVLNTGGYAITANAITLDANTTLVGNASTITLTGTSGTLLTNNGTFTQGTSEVVVTSASGSPTLLSAATTFHKLTINANAAVVNAGAAITMSSANAANKLYVQKGVLNDGGNQIAGTANGTLQVDSGAALCISGTAAATNATCDSGATPTSATIFPTNYTNGNITLAAGASGVSWYNSAWGYRTPVTIDHTKVSTSDQTNFPALISATNVNWKYTGSSGHVGNVDGSDILITASDGITKLDYERDLYVSTTGQLIAWVRVPALSYTADTTLYIYYGNAGVAEQANPNGVWDSAYQGVWHMGTSSVFSGTDSTSTGNTGVLKAPATATTGFTSGGLNITSTVGTTNTNEILVAPTATLRVTTDFTVSAWIKRNATGSENMIMMYPRANGGSCTIGWALNVKSTDKFSLVEQTAGCAQPETVSTTSIGTGWTYVTAVHTGGNTQLYVNGASDSALTAQADPVYTSDTHGFVIGKYDDGAFQAITFNGIIDDVHISNTPRAASWIATEYNNQNSPSTFANVGSESAYSSAPSIVYYNGNVAMTVSATPTYGDIRFQPILTAGRTYTLGGAMTINGNWSINPASSGSNLLTVNAAGTMTVAATKTTFIQRQGSTATSTLDLRPSSTDYNLSTGYLTIASGGTLDATSAASTITLTGTSGTLIALAGIFTPGTSTVTISGNGTATVSGGPISVYNFTQNATGTKSLGGILTVDPAATLTITLGTLDTTSGSNYQISAGHVSIANSASAILTANASAVAITGTSGTLLTRGSAGVFTGGTSMLTLSGNGSATVNSGIFTGTNKFYDLTSSGTGTKKLGADIEIGDIFGVTGGTFDSIDTGGISHAITATNSISIGASGTLKGNASTITDTGNWTNSGAFTSDTSTVAFSGSATAAVSGTTSFYDLTISNATAKEVDFAASGGTPTYTVSHTFTVTGHSGQLIKLYSGTPTTKWDFLPSATATVDYADVKDGGCHAGAILMAPTNSVNSGNNDACWGFNPTLTFSIASALVALSPNISTSTTASGTLALSASTNSASGFSISYNGPTLTKGSYTIPGYSSLSSSVAGTAGFGFNFADAGGYSGLCGVATDYATAAKYTFATGTTTPAASASGATSCTFTSTYKANANSTTAAGGYSTNVTYIITGTF